MENLSIKKSETLCKLTSIEIHPILFEEEKPTATTTKLPFSKVTALGTAFEPIVSAFQTAISDGGQSGLYRVTVPPGSHLAAFQDGSGYLGSVLGNTTNQIAGQSTLSPLVFNPTMLFMALSLISIDKKLDSIQETQQEILGFLARQHRAELKGDLLFLSGVLQDYKYNWNNEKYKNTNYMKALDIKQSAEQKVILCREQILFKSKKFPLFHSDREVKKHLQRIEYAFQDYQLAVYLYSFSSFLAVMLLENFQKGFLSTVKEKIEAYSFQYRELYTEYYNQIEQHLKTSVQFQLLKGLSTASSAAGKAIEKVPLISKSQIDEVLIDTGNRFSNFGNRRTFRVMQGLVDKQSSYVTPFIESINTVNKLYNNSLEIVFDHQNLYFDTTT